MWKEINELGLAPLYRIKKNTSRFLRQLVPSILTSRANIVVESHTIALHSLLEYIEDKWIERRLWTPCSWSVFGLVIRTNNDIDAWYNNLNILCSKYQNVNVYELIGFCMKTQNL